MFADSTTVKIGETALKVKRLTLREIREARVAFRGGDEFKDETYDKLIREHVTTPGGDPIDPTELSLPQMQKLVTELVGIPEGNGISDFIGLLC